MIRLTLAQMRTSGARLVAAGLAIALGTAFITAILLGSGLIRDTTYRAVTATLADADVVVRPRLERLDDDALDRLAGLDGAAAAHGAVSVHAQLAAGAEAGAALVTTAAADDALNPYDLTDGALPARPAELALTTGVAERLGLTVGDTLTMTLAGAPPAELLLTGTVAEPPGILGEAAGALVAPEVLAPVVAAQGYDTVLLAAASGTEPAALAGRAAAAVAGVEALTAEQEAERQTERLTGDARVLTFLVLGFAAVAMVVAALVIANTFQVLVAQRARTLALLRCVGATKAQVRRSVLVEALVLGVGAGGLGLLAGLGLGQAALWFLGGVDLGVELPTGLSLTPTVLAVPVLTGALVTVGAALAPARVATRVAPLEALRPPGAPAPTRGGGRVRLTVAVLLLVLGVVLLVGATAATLAQGEEAVSAMGLLLLAGIAGGLLSLSGLLVGAVFVVPGVVRLLGRGLEALAGRARTVDLATVNAVRNPRRTAATASALVIGVALVVMMATGATTARATLDAELDAQFPVDVLVTTPDGSALTSDHAAAVAAVPGVARTLAVRGTDVAVGGVSVPVYGLDPDGAAGVLRDRTLFAGLEEGEAALGEDLAEELGVADGERLVVQGPAGEVTLTAVLGASVGGLAVAPADLEAIAPTADLRMLWAAAAQGADADAVVRGVEDAVAAATAAGGAVPYTVGPAAERAAFDEVVDTLLTVVVALLGVAVLISLLGVANTLSLSVIERRREHAVLRAIGLTRGQLRRMLAAEGVLIAVTGAAVGAVLGLGYGWAGSAVILGGMGDLRLGVPWTELGAVAAVALLAGLLASVLPARSAVRTPPVAALGAE